MFFFNERLCKDEKSCSADAQSELLYVQSEQIYGCNCYTLTHTVYMLVHASVSEGESEDVKKDQAITPAPQKDDGRES